MNLSLSTYSAKFYTQTRTFLRRGEASVSVAGEPRVRTPPHDGVTLLRAAICLSIVVAHLQPGGPTSWPPFLPFQPTTGWLVSHPRLGFESFFVLAGYFLAHSFRPGPRQTFSVFGFYRRRVVRLLLPYWLILIVSWLAVTVSAARRHEALTWPDAGFWRQMLLLHNLEVNDLVAPQLWFMAPLIQFYLGWGVVFWLARKVCRGLSSGDDHPATMRVMMAMTAVTFCVSIFMDADRGGLDYTLLTNAHYLALGCLVYWYSNARVGIAWLLCALGMEVAVGCATNQSRPIATVVASFLLIYSAGRIYSAGPKLAWPMMIGRYSYSIYLTHMFVGWRAMTLFAVLLGSKANFWGEETVAWMVGVTGCVLVGYGYHRLIERPCARWARAIEYRSVADTPPGLASSDVVRSTTLKGSEA